MQVQAQYVDVVLASHVIRLILVFHYLAHVWRLLVWKFMSETEFRHYKPVMLMI
jgi:hypothetical protein